MKAIDVTYVPWKTEPTAPLYPERHIVLPVAPMTSRLDLVRTINSIIENGLTIVSGSLCLNRIQPADISALYIVLND